MNTPVNIILQKKIIYLRKEYYVCKIYLATIYASFVASNFFFNYHNYFLKSQIFFMQLLVLQHYFLAKDNEDKLIEGKDNHLSYFFARDSFLRLNKMMYCASALALTPYYQIEYFYSIGLHLLIFSIVSFQICIFSTQEQ